MAAAFLSLFIVYAMIVLVIFSSGKTKEEILYCKKSEIPTLLDTISDDTIIQIRIGRNYYEHQRKRNPGG